MIRNLAITAAWWLYAAALGVSGCVVVDAALNVAHYTWLP